jgi:hypothetical protein
MDSAIKSKAEMKEEFKYETPEDAECDDEYEKALEKDIEANCELSVYVNTLEIEEKSDSELLKLEKEDIIDFKNYQIQKLKAYIFSLEKEKEDLIENFKSTTNVLLEKIKENEFAHTGMRPETPFIAKKLKTKQLKENEHKQSTEKVTTKQGNNITNHTTNKQRCPNCTKEFDSEAFLQHSLDCLRNKIRCKKCNEMIEEKISLKTNVVVSVR